MKPTTLAFVIVMFVTACATDRATYTSPAGTFVVSGPVLARYRELGGEGGALGRPVSNPRVTPEGDLQTLFEHGFITLLASGGVDFATFPDATFDATGADVVVRDGFEPGALFSFRGPREIIDYEVQCFCARPASDAPMRPGVFCGNAEVRPQRSPRIRVTCPAPPSCGCEAQLVKPKKES